MPIIFGWNKKTVKQIGITFKNQCSHCHNTEYWVLTKITTWFTLFFVPVIPYSIKHFLSCPICQYGFTPSDEQLTKMKPLAEVNQLLADGKITQSEHQRRITLLNGTPEISTSHPASNAKTLNEGRVNLKFCENCGTSIAKDDKFCSECGVKTVQ